MLTYVSSPSAHDVLIFYLLATQQLYTAKHLHLPITIEQFYQHRVATTVIRLENLNCYTTFYIKPGLASFAAYCALRGLGISRASESNGIVW
jgi:hypothetical protein